MNVRLPVALAICLICAARPADAQAAASARSDAVPEVETVGTGTRRVAPDRASINLVVESRAQSAAAAASLNARAVQVVIDTLRRSGLDTAVTNAGYHVGIDHDPRPATGQPRPRGYVARSVLRVRLTQLDQVGRVIDVALAKGATGVERIWFESSTSEEARRSALTDAAAAARRDAEALARALGGSLGPLLSTSTVGASDPGRNPVAMSFGEVAMARGTQITPSEIVISAAVVTRWQFVPRE